MYRNYGRMGQKVQNLASSFDNSNGNSTYTGRLYQFLRDAYCEYARVTGQRSVVNATSADSAY